MPITGSYGTMYYVKDMAKAVKYYKEAHGLKPRFESHEWTEFDLGGHGLCLHVVGKDTTGSTDGVLITKVTGLTALVEDLKKRGVEFIGPIKEAHPGAHSADFKDLDGNLLSYYEDTNKY